MATSQTVGQRFTELIAHLGISKNAFALSLDKTATVIQHLVDERNKPGFDLLCKVFEVYPNVSKDWLMEGNGPMLTDTAAAPTEAPAAAPAPAASVGAAEEKSVAPAPTPIAAPPVAEVAPAPVEPAAPAAPAAAPESSAPTPAATPAPAADTSWQTALYTQQMAHQLALAELRNQHLQEQQRLMQQMMDLMQRQLAR